MEFLSEYGLFLAKSLTILFSLLLFILVVMSAGQKQKKGERGFVEVTHLNKDLQNITGMLKKVVLEPDDLKEDIKERKKLEKQKKKERKQRRGSTEEEPGPLADSVSVDQNEEGDGKEERNKRQKRVFVLDFEGDMRASQVASLREEVTAILSLAETSDEVIVRLESPGGLVHSYGLAASQLKRIVDRDVKLTVAVDKVAASGGYMMACVANKIVAAPFALLGSIGVVAQIPNFHRLLKKHEVDVEVLTAGEYKRTLTLFGENTDRDREKFLEDMEDVHRLFKQFVSENRPVVDIAEVATGEAWYGTRALEHRLVDELKTSDELIYDLCRTSNVFQVKYIIHKNKLDRLVEKVTRLYEDSMSTVSPVRKSNIY